MIEKLFQQSIEPKIKAKKYVKISVPAEMLQDINLLRKQYGNRHEPQHICLGRIIKFYKENFQR